MARHYIKTVVEFYYESDNDEFANKKEAEEFGWNWDEMMSDGVYSIDVEEFENEEEEDEEESDS